LKAKELDIVYTLVAWHVAQTGQEHETANTEALHSYGVSCAIIRVLDVLVVGREWSGGGRGSRDG
jgi:hypothetical protein